MMRVVVDTNVFVSAVLGGFSAPVIDLWKAGRFRLVATDTIIKEYLEVLQRPKFSLSSDIVDSIVAFLLHKAEIVVPSELLAVVKADPKDDKFLEAAVAGKVDLVVSGDSHLLDLKAYRNIPIVTMRIFIDRLANAQEA